MGSNALARCAGKSCVGLQASIVIAIVSKLGPIKGNVATVMSGRRSEIKGLFDTYETIVTVIIFISEDRNGKSRVTFDAIRCEIEGYQ